MQGEPNLLYGSRLNINNNQLGRSQWRSRHPLVNASENKLVCSFLRRSALNAPRRFSPAADVFWLICFQEFTWEAAGRSAPPRCMCVLTLRRGGSAANGMPGFRVRMPPGSWMSVSCECCVLSGRGLCDGPIPLPEKSYGLWCVIVCDLETWRMRWPRLRKSHGNCCYCYYYYYYYFLSLRCPYMYRNLRDWTRTLRRRCEKCRSCTHKAEVECNLLPAVCVSADISV